MILSTRARVGRARLAKACKNPEAASLQRHVTELSDEASGISSVGIAGSETNGYRYLLYLEILDYARNIALLVQHGFQSNTPVFLVRGMFEALVDLRNLTIDDNSLKDMKLRYFSERKKILERAKEGNKFLQPVNGEDLDELVALKS